MRALRPFTWKNFALFEGDDGDEGAGKGGGGAARTDKHTELTALKARYNGDLERALDVLYDENTRHKAKIGKLETRITAGVAPEGFVLVKKEDSEALEAYRKVAPTPDAVVKKEDLEAANSQLVQVSRERAAHVAAGLLKWKPAVLADLAQSKGLHIEVKEETENGKAIQRAYARPIADEKAPLILLQKHIDEKLADYLPALRVQGQGLGLPPMHSAEGQNGDGGGAASLVDKHIAAQQKAATSGTNPLLPARN